MRNLYVLPFDHRGSFAKMFGMKHGELTGEQADALRDYKHVIYEGFLAALKMGIRKDDAAILVDEELGAKILEEAAAAGITRILTTEKSGQDEFDFEYGDAFREHIEHVKPDYVKVLVRYNVDDDKEMNKRQRERLKIMNDFCAGARSNSSGQAGYKFLFELLVPPTEEQLGKSGSKEDYENNMEWEIMRRSISELKSAEILPDVWKIEGLESRDQFAAVVEESSRGVNKEVGVIVLGRGESGEKVRKWLSAAAGIHGVIGLAVGRTVFKEPLMDFAAGKISREEAVSQIAKNYKGFVDLFEESGIS